jgi:hypothetical protein
MPPREGICVGSLLLIQAADRPKRFRERLIGDGFPAALPDDIATQVRAAERLGKQLAE